MARHILPRMNVLVVPDKFKGTLTAREAAAAIQRGWLAARPQDVVQLLPMSDGGDGFGEILSDLLGAREQKIQTVDAAHRPCEASWWWLESERTAIIESARIIGLARLPAKKYHPFELDTFGLGAVLQSAAEKGAERCLVGIGGSATNDAGFGVAKSLGWQFLDFNEKPIASWTNLAALARLIPPAAKVTLPKEIIVAVDVQNPLLGPTGCTRVYGPQKGLRPQDFDLCDHCLSRLANTLRDQLGLDCAAEPGAGAAGGLGFGLRSFTGTTLQAGFEIFSRYARLRERIKSVQLAITGEGSIDQSTLMGKGVGEIAQLCRRESVPCVGLAGVISTSGNTPSPFTEVFAMAPDLAPAEQALSEPAKWLEQLAGRVAFSFASFDDLQ